MVEVNAVQMAGSLMDQIRQCAKDLAEIAADNQANAERIADALRTNSQPFGVRVIHKDAEQLFRQMRDAGQLAWRCGVKREAVEAAQRGEFVSPQDWGFTFEEMVNTAARAAE